MVRALQAAEAESEYRFESLREAVNGGARAVANGEARTDQPEAAGQEAVTATATKPASKPSGSRRRGGEEKARGAKRR